MDVAYIVRPGDANIALRYSLRSLVNLPNVDRVWIVGHQPRWVTGVHHVPGNPHARDKPRNVWANIRTIAEHDDMSERVVVMNDDFYVMHPVTHVEPLYRGPLAHQINAARPGSWWHDSLTATRDHLEQLGHHDPLSWELHVPVVMDRGILAKALARAEAVQPNNPPQWRTLYHHEAGTVGQQAPDHKYRWRPDAPYWSSSHTNFSRVRPRLHRAFPLPSPYEAAH